MSLPLKSALDSASKSPEEDSGDNVWQQTGSDQGSSPRPQFDFTAEASESLAGFFESIAPQATRFAMSITRRWCEAEELVQESFFRIARAEKKSESEGPERQIAAGSRKSYLFTTIRNLAIDRIRKAKRRPVEQRELDTIAGPTRRLEREQQSSLRQLETTVESSFENMPTQWADAIKLKINGELSYVEIAAVLEATTDQVRGWIYRARKQIAAELRQKGLIGNDS